VVEKLFLKNSTYWLYAFLGLVLVCFYCSIAWLARGGDEWWYIDFVAGANVYWGDDAYRYFLARTAWLNPDIYWFNFILPLAAILDGCITTLAGGDFFFSRALKSLPLVASLFMVYGACVHLKVKRFWAAMASISLATTPVYVFVALSFYGESWLIFFVCLAFYLLASKKTLLGALVIGLMPLIRLESLGFVAGFAIMSAGSKAWRPMLIVFMPGIIYFFMILLIGPGVSTYLAWRFEIMNVYEAVEIWYGGELSRVFDVLYWPWVLAAFVGLLFKEARLLWSLCIGATIIVLRVMYSMALEIGSFEPRFLVAALPVMAVGLALLLQRLEVCQFNGWLTGLLRIISIGFIGLILFLNITSIHVFGELHQYVVDNGRLPASVKERPLTMGTYFKKADAEKVSGFQEYAEVAMQMIEKNPAIDTLVVSGSNVLYFLDPERIGENTRVVFALFGWATLDPVLDGAVTFGYFSSPPYASYYALEYPQDGKSLLLYLDDMKLDNYPYHWVVKGNNIYLFSATGMATATVKSGD
tara:strand:- start:8391 stop:9974 length:1584 start_codon:yes stop_codon:yes gene_type:complete